MIIERAVQQGILSMKKVGNFFLGISVTKETLHNRTIEIITNFKSITI